MNGLPATLNSLQVLNPASREVIGEVANSSQPEVEAAVAAAHRASGPWAACTERAGSLLECAKTLKGNTVRLARILTEEQGKPLRESMEELLGSARWLRNTTRSKVASSAP